MPRLTLGFGLLLAMLLAGSFEPSTAKAVITVWYPPPALPVYVQPRCAQPGLIWTPGYWLYDPNGYFWVPGAWVSPPYKGALWTPPYWSRPNSYVFHEGHWALHVGYYGGVNYGFGYQGVGFSGGVWRGDDFAYNTDLANVDSQLVHLTYVNLAAAILGFVPNPSHTSYSGGTGGVQHDPTPQEIQAQNDAVQGPTAYQVQIVETARMDHASYAKNNNGHPGTLALAATPTGDVAPPAQRVDDSSRDQTVSKRGFANVAAAPGGAANPHVPIPHNYALLFATGNYAAWPQLTNPIPDADALSQTLQSLYDFQAEEVKNPTNEQILAKLTEYLHRTFQPQDQLLIFFSGHGYFDNDLGQGFIVPANAPLVTADPGHTRLLAHDTIMRYVNRIPSLHVVLIIDACFAGTLDRKIADSGLRGDPSLDIYAHASLPEMLQRKEPKRTRRYFASGGKDFVPDGKPGHHSPFLAAFLVTLNQAADRKGYATLDDIQLGLNTVVPEPRWGDIQDENEPGADFILLTRTAVNQLTAPN